MSNEPSQDVQGQLRGLLSRLPDAPVASNFTARVLQAVEVEDLRRFRWHFPQWNWRIFFPRMATVAVVAGFAAVGFHRYELSVQRQKLAQAVALVAASQPAPSVDALRNFDAIQRMSGQAARPDNELLALASDMQ
jgi:hypothetical protein